jgi:hypothetical protein
VCNLFEELCAGVQFLMRVSEQFFFYFYFLPFLGVVSRTSIPDACERAVLPHLLRPVSKEKVKEKDKDK